MPNNMNIIKHHLPQECYSKRDMTNISGEVIHYISAVNILPDDPFNFDAIIKIFKDYKVSAHYYIDREGQIFELVPLPKRAYHAGRSIMNGQIGCNNFMVGVELAGGATFDFTDDEMAALYELSAHLMTEYKFTLSRIQGHDDVRQAWNTANPHSKASIKVDPGPHFPWLDLQTTLLPVSEAINHA